MIKFLENILSKQSNKASVSYEYIDRHRKLWTSSMVKRFIEMIRAVILNCLDSMSKNDPEYLKALHWVELLEIIMESIEHDGMANRIVKSLGLEVKEDSNENNNQQS